MLQLIRVWFDICLFRRAPQDLPASGFLLGVSLCCYGLVSVLVSLQSYTFSMAVLLTAVDLGLLAVFAWSLLYLQKKTARLNQTLSALAGTGSLMGLIALPLLLTIAPDAASDPVPAPLQSLWLLLLLWNLFIMAHIIRHALSSSFAIGFGISLLYALLNMQVIVTLFSAQVV
ncbi:MAG: hypothetical protein WBP44_12745 [Gammaproteobacteria bacterium]|jgi:hypothetical protein